MGKTNNCDLQRIENLFSRHREKANILQVTFINMHPLKSSGFYCTVEWCCYEKTSWWRISTKYWRIKESIGGIIHVILHMKTSYEICFIMCCSERDDTQWTQISSSANMKDSHFSSEIPALLFPPITNNIWPPITNWCLITVLLTFHLFYYVWHRKSLTHQMRCQESDKRKVVFRFSVQDFTVFFSYRVLVLW